MIQSVLIKFIKRCLSIPVVIVIILFCACSEENNIVNQTKYQETEFQIINVSCSFESMWGNGYDVISVGSGSVCQIKNNNITDLNFSSSNGFNYLSNQIFGFSEGKIYVSGGNNKPRHEFGDVYCYLDGNWTVMNVGATSPINSVWGVSDSELVAVGENGGVFNYNGQTWQKDLNVGTNTDLNAVFGYSSNDIVIVGDSGLILYLNGNEWEKVNTNVKSNLRSIWKDISNKYYVVGDSGIILYGNRDSWEIINSGVNVNLNQIRSSEDGSQFITGDSGIILSNNNGQWISITNNFENDNFSGLWVNNNGHLLAGTYEGLLIDINESDTSILNLGVRMTSLSIWGSSFEDFYLIGGGEIYHKFKNRIKQVNAASEYYSYPLALTGIDSTGTHLFIGGSYGDPLSPRIDGFIKQFNGSSWSPSIIFPFATCLDLSLISVNNVYAAFGSHGLIHYDGQQWAFVNELLDHSVRSVWCKSPESIFAVGDSGLVAHYNGVNWNIDYIQPYDRLIKVRGSGDSEVAAVGANGTALIYDGTLWNTIQTNSTDTLRDIWISSLEKLIVVGDNGLILEYDGTNWHEIVCEENENLYSIWGFGSDEIIIGGSNGLLLFSL